MADGLSVIPRGRRCQRDGRRCRQRTIEFALPPIESTAAMEAVTSTWADGVITPGEAGTRSMEAEDSRSVRKPRALRPGGPAPGRAGRPQPLGEFLLLIRCRCSKR
jgi:hypothetical protein